MIVEPQIDTDESSSESEDDNVRVSKEKAAEILQSMGWNTNNKGGEKYWYFKVLTLVIYYWLFLSSRELQ